MFPETAGKTLEDTEKMFTDPNGIKYIGTPAWKTKVNYQEAQRAERGEISKDKLGSMSEYREQSPETKEKV